MKKEIEELFKAFEIYYDEKMKDKKGVGIYKEAAINLKSDGLLKRDQVEFSMLLGEMKAIRENTGYDKSFEGILNDLKKIVGPEFDTSDPELKKEIHKRLLKIHFRTIMKGIDEAYKE